MAQETEQIEILENVNQAESVNSAKSSGKQLDLGGLEFF